MNLTVFSQISSENTRFVKDSTGTYIIVNSREAKAVRLLKIDKDYYKNLSDSLRASVMDLESINESLTSENLLHESVRSKMQYVIDRERSYNILTNKELDDLTKRFKKRGWTIAGVSGGSAVVIGGILYVTLGPHTRK